MQVNASLQNQNLPTDLRRVAKCVGSQVTKSRKFHAYCWLMRFYNRLLVINLCRLALGGQMVRNLRLLASKFELNASRCKSAQVGGQTKRKLNTSPKLATCVSDKLMTRGSLLVGICCYFHPLPTPLNGPAVWNLSFFTIPSSNLGEGAFLHFAQWLFYFIVLQEFTRQSQTIWTAFRTRKTVSSIF